MRILAALGIVLVAACSAAPPVPVDRFYRLPLPAGIESAAAYLDDATVLVRTFAASGVHTERAVLFSDDPEGLSLQQHHYHFWADPPPRLLQRQLIEYLRLAAPDARISDDAGRRSDWLVSGRLLEFERLQGYVAVRVELRVDAGDTRELVLLDSYDENMAINGTGMLAVVEAFAAATDAVYRRFLRDLAEQNPGVADKL